MDLNFIVNILGIFSAIVLILSILLKVPPDKMLSRVRFDKSQYAGWVDCRVFNEYKFALILMFINMLLTSFMIGLLGESISWHSYAFLSFMYFYLGCFYSKKFSVLENLKLYFFSVVSLFFVVTIFRLVSMPKEYDVYSDIMLGIFSGPLVGMFVSLVRADDG